MQKPPKYPVTTLMKSLDILNYLADNATSSDVDISEISRALNMGKSTVHRLLDTLLYYDYVKKNPSTNKYSLGWQLYKIGKRVISRNQVFNLDRRFLDQLSRKVQETVNLGILNENEVVILSKIDYSVDDISQALSPVIREATYATSLGKVLLCEKTDEEIRILFKDTSFHSLTPSTITGIDEFIEEIHKVRKQGYGVDNQELALGLFCIACPIRDYSGNIIAGVSVSLPYVKAIDTKDIILKELTECCDKISQELGYMGDQLLSHLTNETLK